MHLPSQALSTRPLSRTFSIGSVSFLAIAFALPCAAQTKSLPPQNTAASQDEKADKVVVTGQRDYVLPETSAATKTETPVLLTPQSVQVVPRAILNEQKAIVLTDAVRNVAGVSNDFGFNGMSQPLLILRGFSATSMTAGGSMSGSSSYYLNGVKVSGIPVNMADVEAVEVVKGPNTVLFGRAEPGGIVNVVQRDFSETPRFSAEQTLGSYELSRTVVEGAAPLNDDRTVRAKGSASYFTSNSDRDFVQERLGAVSVGLAWVPDQDTRLAATVDYTDQKYRTDFGVPEINGRLDTLSRSRQFNDAHDLSSVESLSVRIEGQRRFGDDWEIKAKASALTADTSEVDIWPYRVDYGLNPPETCDGTGANLCRYYFYDRPDGKYDVYQGTVDLIGKVITGPLSHLLLFGVDGYSSEKSGTTYFQQINSIDTANPDFSHTTPLDPALAMPEDRLDRSRWTSAYVQDQIDLGGGLHGVLAVRHDWTSAIFDLAGTAPNKVEATTPRVGLVWEFQPGQSVYGQYQDALSANNGRDPSTGDPLEPEKSRQTEIGYKFASSDSRLIATLAAYELTKRNRADYTLYPIVRTIGEARSRGIELDVIGQVTSDLAIMGSYAYTDAKVIDNGAYAGTRLANVPYNAASLWARYALSDQWSLGGGAFYVGEREADVGNTYQLPAYTRIDVMAAYDFRAFGANASLQLNIKNLFDEEYFVGSHQFVSDWNLPGPPRSASISLRFEK